MTPPILWTDVLAHAPELSTVDVNAQDDLLAFVNESINESSWGTPRRTKLARIYYAAHLATLAKARGAVRGPLTSESEGGVAVSYAPPLQATATELGTTSYGQLYLELRRHIAPRVGFVL